MRILNHTFINHDNESMEIEIWQLHAGFYEEILYDWKHDVVENLVSDTMPSAIYTYGQLIKKYSK